jgi:hypothetical protein
MHKEKYKGYKIKIKSDDDVENPRAWDNLGTIYGLHRNYNIGDHEQNPYRSGDFDGWEDFKERLEQDNEIAVILPVFMYDHSGLVFNTTGFSCPWDSGQVGFIFVTREKLAKEAAGWTQDWLDLYHEGKTMEDVARKILAGEVETYSKWANGEGCGYVVTHKKSGFEDSCWGYLDLEDALAEAKAAVDYHAGKE